MNANELADWIQVTDFYENTDDHFINDTMDEVEAMLRQLQAENEALKANFNKENPVKEVFNKPVAWMQTWQNQDGELKQTVNIEQIGKNDIPLYAHPKGFNWLDVSNEKLMNEVRNRGYIISDAKVSSHPVKEFNDGGEPVKNATYWKRQYNLMASQNDNLKSGLYHANEQIKYLEAHPVELTDEEIEEFAYAFQLWQLHNPDKGLEGIMAFARAILKRAQKNEYT